MKITFIIFKTISNDIVINYSETMTINNYVAQVRYQLKLNFSFFSVKHIKT